MKVISCFAGLGGAELALKRAGIQAEIYAYEIDKYAEAVNRYNNPDSVFLGDITKWKEHTDMIGEVDLIIGAFLALTFLVLVIVKVYKVLKVDCFSLFLKC